MDDDIPDFLRIPQAERRATWKRNPPKPRAADVARQSSWAVIDAQRKQEARNRIAKLKARHPGKTWDAKRGEWVEEKM